MVRDGASAPPNTKVRTRFPLPNGLENKLSSTAGRRSRWGTHHEGPHPRMSASRSPRERALARVSKDEATEVAIASDEPCGGTTDHFAAARLRRRNALLLRNCEHQL